MVWYGVVWYGMVWYGMVWYGMVWYGMVWYGMVWYGTAEAREGGEEENGAKVFKTRTQPKEGWEQKRKTIILTKLPNPISIVDLEAVRLDISRILIMIMM